MTRLLSWTLFLLAMAITAAAIGFMLANRSTPDLPEPFGYRELEPLLAVAFGSCGLLLTQRVPGNAVGWLFSIEGVISALGSFFQGYTIYGTLINPGSLPAPELFAWLYEWIWVPQVGIVAVFLPLLFPDGRILPQWRPVARFGAIGLLIASFGVAFHPGELQEFEGLANPLPAPGALADVADVASVIGIAASVIVAILGAAAQIRRYRQADGEERHQIKWFAAATTLVAATFAVVQIAFAFAGAAYWQAAGKITETSLVLSICLVPLAVGVAVLRYRLYDIDIIINRTLVYVPLTGILAGLYVALMGLLKTFFTEVTGSGSDAAIALSTLTIAALLTPVKNQLQTMVDKCFKQVPDPARELLDMAAQASSVLQIVEAERFIEAFISKAAAAFEAAYVTANLRLPGQLERRFEAGSPEALPELTLPLLDGETEIGSLVLGPRAGGRPYSAAEVDALTRAAAVVGEVARHDAQLGDKPRERELTA